MSKYITFFQRKFETKPYEEEAAAEFDNEKKKYVNFSLDIGWSMHKIYGPRKQKNDQCTVIGCKNCGSVLEHVDTCPAEVRYRFVNTKCKLEQIGNHNHGPYVSNHLSEEEKDKLTERLLVNPTVTLKAAVQGINRRTGQIVDLVVDINLILGTRDRVEYELNKRREQINMPRKGEFLGEFGKIMNNYTGYFLYAQVIPGSFLLMYRSPAIKTYCRFSNLPAVTDVTYKAIEKGYYLCTTVMYIKELKKHAVIFQAVMDGLSYNYFAQHFFAFFTEYKVKFDGEDSMLYALMQSVQRISSNNNIIPYDEADKFRELVYTIRTTKDAEEFCRSCNEVVTRYKNSYKWLQWWLQPSISSMIFRHSLPQILNYIRSDERILSNYKKHAVPATYNRAPRATHKRPSKKTVNDGCPPDVTKKTY
ncbi:hypothetical protein INT45_005524 [Circinella minor]|uniref:Uncharacterized protein n=1 Tax=Circinella minor TaxID=1195481 RepID=A0A8H7RUP7_9FUNG|nr:hypothetical protein INT45_005524 [Circinella minor]